MAISNITVDYALLRSVLLPHSILIVQVYDSVESDLKLNDVFEFVGVLTFDPEVTVDKDDSEELTQGLCEDTLVHLPPSKVLIHISVIVVCYFSYFLSIISFCMLSVFSRTPKVSSFRLVKL